jgi:branched-chain amino acid transport system ATP-binding protein
MLETRDLTIRFGGHVAVNAVSCAFAPGTLTAIVGPNGAGKTTYFNLISGQLQGQRRQVTLGGQDLTGQSPRPARARAGAGVSAHQPVPGPQRAGERAPGRAGHAAPGRTAGG